MRVIHTADWHLGKILNGKHLLEDQAYILDVFIDEMKQHTPDIIIIAGDIYDTSYPSKDAIKLFERTLFQLNIELGIPIILINGNHDGRERLNYGSIWFEHSNIYIRTELKNMDSPVKINNINFYTMPYATVSEVSQFFEDETIKTNQQATDKILEHISKDLNDDEINFLIGHLTIQGGKTSDSERPLTIGTVESVSKQTFNQFDRVLLGHLHHPFSINSDFINYSGSLLQYSFSEAGQAKGFRALEVTSKDEITETFIQLKPLRELEVIEGEYDEVISGNIEIKSKFNYFHFKLKQMSHISDPMINLKKIYPNTLALTNINQLSNEINNFKEITRLKDEDIISQFYNAMTDNQLTEIQKQKVELILNDVQKEEGHH